jgi:hypothetical protein
MGLADLGAEGVLKVQRCLGPGREAPALCRGGLQGVVIYVEIRHQAP